MRVRLAVGIVCLPLLVPACFSSSSDDTAAPVDSGGAADAEPGPDATMTTPMEAAAPEAAVPEAAAPDAVAMMPDATPAPTTVTVFVVNDLGPEQGVSVVFQDATGAVVGTVVTDAAGKATATAAAGSQVTGAFGAGSYVQLVTIEGVVPGDVLTMYDSSNTNNANAVVYLDSLPDAGPPNGADTYVLNVGPCHTSFATDGFPVALALSPDCESRGKFPVLVQALISETSTEVGYTYQTGNALATDGGQTHFSLNGAWSTDEPTQTINVSNFDPGTAGYATFSEIANGVPFGPPAPLSSDGDGGANRSYPGHPGYPASVQREMNATAGRPAGSAVSAIATRGAPPGDGGVANFDESSLLPLLDAVNLDSTQPAQPTVSWVTEAGSLAGASGTIVSFSWSEGDNSVQGSWTILAPPTATSVTAPALPSSLSAWAPMASPVFGSPPVVVVVAGSGALAPDYAHLRTQFSALPTETSLLYDDLSLDAVIPPLPVDGTLRLTAFTTSN